MKSYLLSIAICLFCFLHAKHHTRPNVIFVLADDLGIGDVSPTNPDCKIKTPHLQKMADEGIPLELTGLATTECCVSSEQIPTPLINRYQLVILEIWK